LRARPPRPSQPALLRGEPPSPASAVSTVCSGLDRPSTACLATRREARSRCVPTDFCIPLLRLRAPAPRRFPASLRSLRFALGPGLAPTARGPEDLAFHDARSASAGRPGSRAAYFVRALPSEPSLLAPLSPPHSPRLRFRTSRAFGAAETLRPTLREDEAGRADPGCLPSVGDARAPARTVADLECGHVMVSASIRPSTPFHPQPCAALARSHVGRGLDPRPRTLPRSGEMESTRFSESDAAYRLLQTDLRRAGTPLERPILARLERTTLFKAVRPSRLPSPPAPPLSSECGARQPTSLEVSGQRATSSRIPVRHPAPARAAVRLERGRPSLLVALLAGNAPTSPVVAPRVS